jgi:hypothetical protein
MTAPATPAPAPTPLKPAATHGCARCGAQVALDVGLCESCNPLGLRDSASSQVHGTVILTVGLAVATMAVLARVWVSGIGPFAATAGAVRSGAQAGTATVPVTVTNQGHTAGSATCRITDPQDPGLVNNLVVYTPRIEPGATATWDQDVSFGTPDRPLAITCQGP